MTTPLSVSVMLPASGEFGKPDTFGERHQAEQVEYRAHRDENHQRLVVSVTAYAADHRNKTWVSPDHFVADGPDSSEPPEWVPAAPAWFWVAVGEMGGAR